MDEKPLVLLVEDFDDAREMYAEYLQFSGFRTAGAADAGLRHYRCDRCGSFHLTSRRKGKRIPRPATAAGAVR